MREYSVKVGHGLIALLLVSVAILSISQLSLASNIPETVFSVVKIPYNQSTLPNEWTFLIIYIIAPFLFITTLLHAFMNEIGFFNSPNTKKFQLPIALLIAIMSFPAGVYNGLIVLFSQIGATLTLVVFFAAFFGLALSAYYRRKANQFDFFMGSRFLTIMIIHSPLLIFGTLAGWVLGPIIVPTGMANTFSGSSAAASGMVGSFFDTIINYFWWTVLIGGVVAFLWWIFKE